MCIRDRDRDNNYDRVKLAYDALTKGEGETAPSGPEGIQQSYDKGDTDEFVKPTVVVEGGAPIATIKAVSYTHLDVYKRQACGCRPSSTPMQICRTF